MNMAAITGAAAPARFDRAAQHRRAMIAKIQIARKQLGIVEDDYRQALLDETGQFSLTACTDAQLRKVLVWLSSKGFRPMPSKSAAQHPMAKKARALWISLYQLGIVHNPGEPALEAFAKRQLGCERLVWARQSDGNRLIEALKAMAARAGWRQTDLATQRPLSPLGLQSSLCYAILEKLKSCDAIPRDWSLDQAAFRLCGIETAQEDPWTAEDYTRLAAAFGAELRARGGQAS